MGRLAYGCSEEELRAAMERFAAVDRVVIVKDLAGKPRGYGFVEFREAEGMKSAYRRTNHLEIAGRRVVVDVERGRTVKGWLPRRAGGGLGGESRAPRPTKRELKRLNQLQGQNSRPGWGAPPPRGPGAYSGAGFGGRGGLKTRPNWNARAAAATTATVATATGTGTGTGSAATASGNAGTTESGGTTGRGSATTADGRGSATTATGANYF